MKQMNLLPSVFVAMGRDLQPGCARGGVRAFPAERRLRYHAKLRIAKAHAGCEGSALPSRGLRPPNASFLWCEGSSLPSRGLRPPNASFLWCEGSSLPSRSPASRTSAEAPDQDPGEEPQVIADLGARVELRDAVDAGG